MDDECRIRQTNTNCTIDIFIGSKPAEEFDVCLDRFLQNENSREREIKVVEMIGKQEYLDELKPYEIGSWGDTFVSSSIHYHAPDEHTETDEVNEAALAAAIADEPISQQHLMNVISSHRSSLESTIRPIGFDR